MSNSQHHLCLVSEQPMPNYLPIMATEIRPATITLAVTEKMKHKAEWLRQELTKHGIVVQELFLGEHASAFDDLQNKFMEWLDSHEKENVVLNATGGTKAMAIAAQESFRMAGKPVFYVDIATDQVWWLDSSVSTPKWIVKCTINRPVTTDTYLNLHGISLKTGQQSFDNPKWLHYAQELAKNAGKWGESLKRLNYLAGKAEKENTLNGGGLEYHDACWMELLQDLWGNEITKEPQKLFFCSEESRRFANGGWLEAYLFQFIEQIIPNKQTTYLNAILKGQSGEQNEIDVLTLMKNKLYVFECKTRDYSKDDSASEAIYKLQAIQKSIGGLRTTGVLVSYLDLNQYDKRRADSYGIKIISPKDLHPDSLKGILLNLLKG